jgi:hypothetical protein
MPRDGFNLDEFASEGEEVHPVSIEDIPHRDARAQGINDKVCVPCLYGGFF